MKFTLTIDLNDAAFADDLTGKLATCLRDVATTVTYYSPRSIPTLAAICGGDWYSDIRDSNGNAVGEWKFVE